MLQSFSKHGDPEMVISEMFHFTTLKRVKCLHCQNIGTQKLSYLRNVLFSKLRDPELYISQIFHFLTWKKVKLSILKDI